MDKLQFLSRLGAGSYATVYKARENDTGQIVAVKEFKESNLTLDLLLNNPEIYILRQAGASEYITQLRSVSVINGRGFLIMDLAEGSLLSLIQDYINKGKLFSESEIRTIMKDILQGLAHLHSKNIIHRDIKPENILLTRSNRLNRAICKLCDFGQATVYTPVLNTSVGKMTPYVATRWYRAPELLVKETYYTSAVDIWAAGCLFAELLLLRPLFAGTSEADQLFRILSCIGNMAGGKDLLKKGANVGYSLSSIKPIGLANSIPNASREVIAVLERMLQLDPTQRAKANELLNMPFFTKGPDSNLRIIETNQRLTAAEEIAAKAAAAEAQAILEADISRNKQQQQQQQQNTTTTNSGNTTLTTSKGDVGSNTTNSRGSSAGSIGQIKDTSARVNPVSESKYSSSSIPTNQKSTLPTTTNNNEQTNSSNGLRRKVIVNPFEEITSSSSSSSSKPNSTSMGYTSSLSSSTSNSKENKEDDGDSDSSGEAYHRAFGGKTVFAKETKSTPAMNNINNTSSVSTSNSSSSSSSSTIGLGILQNSQRRGLGSNTSTSNNNNNSRGSSMAALFGGGNTSTNDNDSGAYVPTMLSRK